MYKIISACMAILSLLLSACTSSVLATGKYHANEPANRDISQQVYPLPAKNTPEKKNQYTRQGKDNIAYMPFKKPSKSISSAVSQSLLEGSSDSKYEIRDEKYYDKQLCHQSTAARNAILDQHFKDNHFLDEEGCNTPDR